MSVENTDRRTFFHQQGTNELLNDKYFDFSETNAKLFYLGPLTQLNELDQFNDEDNTRTNASKLLENACQFDLETIVDFSSGKNSNYSRIAKSSLPFIDHLVINETEAGLIFNKILTSDNLIEIKQIANDFIDLDIKNHFLQGSIILPDNFSKSSVGAGNAFVSGMIYGIYEQYSLDKILNLTVCVAAMSR